MSAFGGIVLQKSLNAERRFFRLKPKQARTDNKGDSRSITEVTGEFSARLCDPPHPYMKNAPMAQKFCDQGRKTTFATQSAKSRHSGHFWILLLAGKGAQVRGASHVKLPRRKFLHLAAGAAALPITARIA